MARPANPNSIFNFGLDILSSSFSQNGTISLQTGAVLGPEAPSDTASEIWFPPGYLARPAKAHPNKDAAQGISAIRGDHDVVFAFKDVRANSLQEQIGFGEIQLYAGGPDNSGISKIVLNNDGTNQKITVTVGSKIIQIKSDGSIILGSGDDTVMLGTDLLTWITQVNVALTTLNAAAGSLVPPIVVPSAQPKASNTIKASL